MTGWKIFSHSVFLLNHNLKDAIRISSPLIVTMILSLVIGGAITVDNLESGATANEPLSVLLQILTGVAGLWVAVAWHRFVLLEEHGGSLPTFHGRRMLSYFFVILLLTVMLALVAGGAGALAGIVFGVATPLFAVAVFVVLVAVLWAFYRLSPMLPAAALGRPLGPAQAWAETTELSGAILVTGLSLIVVSLFCAAVAALIMFQVSILIGVILFGVLQWAYTMVGISILTTIYGIAIEGRDI
ncbi:hypothetical protein PH5382_00439 [Phaeobacter sp. CECT 5382]|uniref:hypothetical protein n=1 Tax=Pseudophaeobacter sp. TaxID=1971739 RepID=UPI0006DA2363|nr:hypothetical protein PH5382_00439 [Phaeobacter sp. CECT 5382]